ncbi:acyltransferase [Sphingomonas sp. HHU CXW]|uniref:Acyltransferase n=1 Tax=Sphingomonas hominis TaxID=2741495 RepID=A0ABX2JH04_9SPHN|nr:acyltransferase [Sphingomonas hominis]
MAIAGRIGSIDALRGIAALCVCVQHAVHPIIIHPATMPEARAWLSAITVDRFDLGRYGVVLFFLVSGYVVPFSLHGAHALRRFALTRAIRLYPAFWLSLIAVVATAPALPPMAQVVANLTMAPSLLGQQPLSGVYWTLFVELAFYTLCVALFAAGLLRRAGAVFTLGLACVALPVAGVLLRDAGVHAPVVYLGAHLSFLFAGTLMRIAHEHARRAATCYAVTLMLLALAAMPLLAAQPDHSFTLSTPIGVLLAGIAAAATFAMLHNRAGATSPTLLRLGAISYSIYLFHIPVTRVAALIVPPANAGAAILFIALTVAATVALATAVYTGVERPMIARGKRLWRRPTRSSPSHRERPTCSNIRVGVGPPEGQGRPR